LSRSCVNGIFIQQEDLEDEEDGYSHGMKGEPDFDSDPDTSLMYVQSEEVVEDEEPSSGEDSPDDGESVSRISKLC
jgi:hypothetical protein